MGQSLLNLSETVNKLARSQERAALAQERRDLAQQKAAETVDQLARSVADLISDRDARAREVEVDLTETILSMSCYRGVFVCKRFGTISRFNR